MSQIFKLAAAALLLALCLEANPSHQLQRYRGWDREQDNLLSMATSVASAVKPKDIVEFSYLATKLVGDKDTSKLEPHSVEVLLLKLDSIVQYLLKARDVSEESCSDGSFPSVIHQIDPTIPANIREYLDKFRNDQLTVCANVFLKTLGEVRAKLQFGPENDLVRFANYLAERKFENLSSYSLAQFRKSLIDFAASKTGVNASIQLTSGDAAKLQLTLDPVVATCSDIRQALYPVDEIFFFTDWTSVNLTVAEDKSWISYIDLCRGLSKTHVNKTIVLAQLNKLAEPLKLTKTQIPTTRRPEWG